MRVEFKDGRNIEFIPNFAYPLGVSDIRALASTERASLNLAFEANDPIIDGVKSAGRSKISSTIDFSEETKIFGLVSGGWLPLPFVTPQQFLVDRNVVIALRKIRNGATFDDIASFQWWTKFFEEGGATFNPLPYAFESGFRRTPTIEEFKTSYGEGVSELNIAFPKCKIIDYDNRIFTAVYSQLRAFDARNSNELKFLLATCPIVSERKTGKAETAAFNVILALAKEAGIGQGSFALLAVLSCLYESTTGSPISIGRLLLKPTQAYTEAAAYNALSDLRHIELAAAGQGCFKDREFALCTRDKGLALFWSALSIRAEIDSQNVITFNFDLSIPLFERLNLEQIQLLVKQLKQ